MKRSAAAALREFFALSPSWLRASSAAAALALCALVALTLARSELRWDRQGFALRSVPPRVVRETVREPARDAAASAELSALADENARIKAELESLKNRAPEASLVKARVKDDDASAVSRRAADPRRAERTPRRAPRRTQQFARFDDEDALPRLSDLLDEVN